MSKTVVLAEKPSVARDLARVLGCKKSGNGYIEGSKYIVTWALGHLVTLADPERYGDRYKEWKLEHLPIMPKEMKLVVIKKTGKQFQAVKSQLLRKDVKEIVIATDAGREGELVARWILDQVGVRKPIKRLWISSVTDKAIKEGFQRLRNGKDFEPLYASAVARAEADWLVGINGTRALTAKYNASLSCGRVQTPTLAMIAKREEEIKAFKPVPYYKINATIQGVTFTWEHPKSQSTYIFKEEKANELVDAFNRKKATITEVVVSKKRKEAPQLYDLTELQREAHKRYGYSAKETLSITQRLYEQYKVVTYPRTDSRYLSTDMVDTLKDRVKACRFEPYQAVVAQLLKSPIKGKKTFVNNAKVTDHHAIIPTEETPQLAKMSDKERKIYELIVKRFLSVLLPPYEYEQTTVFAKVEAETLKAKGVVPISLGWRKLYNDENEEGEQMTSFQKGTVYPIGSVKKESLETKPPARFNEGTLLTAMENPQKFMAGEQKSLIETIGEAGGLGTVATRADIIEKLFKSFLIEKRGNEIFITGKGKQLLNLVPADLKSPALTAQWEQKLTQIAQGKLKKETFMKEIREYAQKVTKDIKQSEQKFKHDNVTGSKCPECGKLLLEVKGKKGKMHVCQDRECGYRKNISRTTNARCPVCHKKLELRGEGEGQIFVCRCGHREKLSSFEERKKKEKQQKVSRKDIQKYLKKENDETLSNPALADALAKLKLK
ncbi:DNA topoisomerase III [Bacillus kexueae]|uniref:DNA topoisomerase III n=1 Tax=Aeribacillus kexueae TaxID=2078952 RepID=UPI001FAF47A6|nr:DNA topoisomerase III [Bacillus kexueae]